MYDLYSQRHSHYSLDAFQPTFALHSSSHLSLHVTQSLPPAPVALLIFNYRCARPRTTTPPHPSLPSARLVHAPQKRLGSPSGSPAIETARSPLYCSLSVVLVTPRYLAAALAAHYLCIYRIDLHCHPSIFRPHPSIAALSLVTARYIHTPHHPHPSTAISINIYSTSAHAHPPALTHLHTALIVKIAFDRTYKSSPFHAPLTPLGYHPLHKYTCSPSPVARYRMVRPFCVVLRRAGVVQSHPTRPSRPDMHMLRLFALRCVCNVMGFICRPPCVPFSSLNVRVRVRRSCATRTGCFACA